MRWDNNPYSLSLILTAVISLGFTVYTLRRRTIPGALPFFFLMLAVAELSLGYAFEYQTSSLAARIFWSKVEYLGIVTVPVAWLLFALQYTGHSPVRSRRFVLSLLLVPTVTLLLVWTNKLHGLIWQRTDLVIRGNNLVLDLDYGTWFWIHTSYSYLLIAYGTVRLFQFFLHSKGVYRKQVAMVLLGTFIPWLSNVIYILKVDQFQFDMSPFAFAIAGFLATWSFLRFQFLDILPLARDAILDRMQDGVMVLDARNRILDLNRAAQAIVGVELAQVIGQDAERVFAHYGDMVRRFIGARVAHEVLTGGTIESPEYWELNLSSLYDPRGNFTGRLVVLHDITERQLAKLALQNTNIELERRVQERTAQLEETNEKLRASALHDPLTGLPNRRLFMDRLDHAFVRTRRHPGQATAVLFMDLDHFKSVNDNLGHSRGDILLHLIAGRLKSCMRTGDTVARIGGDEFVILLEDIQDASEAVQIAGRLQLELAQPADLDGHEVFTSASIGVALASARHRVPEEILRDADLAMYRAKAKGRGRCETFTPAEFASKQNLLELQVDLGPALEQREFELHYQPIIDLRSGEVVSVEALLRWNHPIFGILYPNQFLQQAEESGWIAPIGEWVLREACAQAKDWHSAGHDRLRVAVNISMRQFFELELRDLVPRVAAETGLHPQFLEVEISERTAMEDLNYSMDTLAELSRIGVQISIDNFGEANNTLEHLNRLPTNSLKIDRAFGIDGRNQLHRASIVPEIIERAHSRRLCIVGKRVETRQQLAALASQDYDQIQGYLISQAVPANRAADLFGVSQREAFLTLSETPEINHR